MLWIVTSMAGLTAVYGGEGASQIEAKIAQLAAAIPNASLQLLASDSQIGVLGAAALYSELKSKGPQPDNLLLIGDQRVFPGFTFTNPVTDRALDPDVTVLTDSPFGVDNWTLPQQCAVPNRPVGRIAPGIDQSAVDFCALLDTQIALRQSQNARSGYVEVVSRQWQQASSSVMAMSAPAANLIVSPDGRVTAANASTLDCKYLYCNLHGFINAVAWSGYDLGLSYPVAALTPDAFQAQFVNGTVVFSEACYGLAVAGKPTNASNALALQAAGAAAIVGATGLAYGSATTQPQTLIDADVLARSFFNAALTPRITTGQCLQTARQQLRATSSISDPYVLKTLLEFQLLGDPSYVVS